MSSSIAFLRSPNPGAFTAAQCSVPRILFTTSVASASPSTSSATTSRGRLRWTTCSSSGSRSFMIETRGSWRRMKGSSSTHSIRAGSVTKYGERYPRSNCIPSTTSRVVSVPLASCSVTTPSFPTRSTASATSLPMASSLWAATVAIWAFSRRLWTGREILRTASTAAFSPRSSPFFRSTALEPATTFRTPSAKRACARSVAVEVPSPTTSPVFSAAWRIIRAPRFSSGSLSSTSLATVTPSLQTSGAPHRFSMRTHLDFGPSVTRTASARSEAPRRTFSRASDRNRICLCGMVDPPRRAASPPSGRSQLRTPRLHDA
ncbi:MAG: uncharacterized protein H6Q88_950 [Anaeromyxobacteraceae bacterium]|nr:uncharacterized protein [Anaeromyxobacteraceae bacterium]